MMREQSFKKRKLKLEREELQLNRRELGFEEEELEIVRAGEQLEVRGDDDDEVTFVSENHIQNPRKFAQNRMLERSHHYYHHQQ